MNNCISLLFLHWEGSGSAEAASEVMDLFVGTGPAAFKTTKHMKCVQLASHWTDLMVMKDSGDLLHIRMSAGNA